MDRPSLPEIFMKTALLFAERCTCTRAKIGCVITKDNRIITTGYTGAPAGQPHCLDVGCLIDSDTGGCIRTLHAEANAIAYAAKMGLSLKDSDLYVTMSPCLACAKLIVSTGIRRVFYTRQYRDIRGIEFLEQNNVKVFHI